MLFILDDENVGAAVFSNVLASLDTVGWINPGRDSTGKNCAKISQEPFRRIESQDSDAVMPFETELDESFGYSLGF